MYDFLLVINTNLLPILHCFRDIAFDTSKIAILRLLLLSLIPPMEGFPISYHRKRYIAKNQKLWTTFLSQKVWEYLQPF